jgi:hypothetical protein
VSSERKGSPKNPSGLRESGTPTYIKTDNQLISHPISQPDNLTTKHPNQRTTLPTTTSLPTSLLSASLPLYPLALPLPCYLPCLLAPVRLSVCPPIHVSPLPLASVCLLHPCLSPCPASFSPLTFCRSPAPFTPCPSPHPDRLAATLPTHPRPIAPSSSLPPAPLPARCLANLAGDSALAPLHVRRLRLRSDSRHRCAPQADVCEAASWHTPGHTGCCCRRDNHQNSGSAGPAGSPHRSGTPAWCRDRPPGEQSTHHRPGPRRSCSLRGSPDPSAVTGRRRFRWRGRSCQGNRRHN